MSIRHVLKSWNVASRRRDGGSTPNTLPLLDARPPPPLFGGVVDSFESQIDAVLTSRGFDGAAENGADTLASDSPSEVFLMSCLGRAFEEHPDPSAPLFAWLDRQDDEIEASVQGDDRIVNASSEIARCIREGGYEFETSDEATNYLFDLAVPIWESFLKEKASATETREKFSELRREETTIAGVVTPCLQQYLNTAGTVRAEAEQEWLKRNGEALVAEAAALAESLAPYEDYLQYSGG